MDKNFNKFKRKIYIECLIKSAIIAFSCSLILFATAYIYMKVKGIGYATEQEILGIMIKDIYIYLCLLLLGCALIMISLTALIFFLMKPSNKKIAKRLDKELSLNEKVQTFIEYKDQEGTIINLQRHSTLNILANTAVKKLSMKFGVIIFILLGIAMSCGITSIAIPAKQLPPDPGIVDPDYETDDWTILSILQLIEYVKASNASDDLKTKYIDELNNLIEGLEEVSKESEKDALVLSTIDTILLELDKENTNNEVFSVLRTSDNALVVSLGVEINLLNVEKVTNAIDSFIILISGSADAITELDPSFGVILKKSNLDKKDELYIALENFVNAINGCKDASNINDAVRNVVFEYKEIIPNIITKQSINQEVALYLEAELRNIFDLNENTNTNEDGKNNNDSSNSDGSGNDDKLPNNGSGGLGTGETLFGSNEAFFDPEEGKVVYGDVITKYYGEIIGKLDEGSIPEELREYFNYYYDILFGDLNENENK